MRPRNVLYILPNDSKVALQNKTSVFKAKLRYFIGEYIEVKYKQINRTPIKK